jgi:hypothetical protein
MKKAILTIGLFTIVTALTSFAKPTTANVPNNENSITTNIDGTGGQSSGDNKKVDLIGGSTKLSKSNQIVKIDGTGGQSSGDNKKVD